MLILACHRPVGPSAFHAVFGWLTATAVLALGSAGWLAFEQRRVAEG